MKIIIAFLLLSIVNDLSAQKKFFTMDDAVINLKGKLAPKNLKQLAWIPYTKNYYYLDTLNAIENIFLGEVGKKEKTILFSINQLNDALKLKGLTKTEAIPTLTLIDNLRARLIVSNELFEIKFPNLLAQKTIELTSIASWPEASENQDVCDETGYVTYLGNDNLYIVRGKEHFKITNDGSKDVVYGKAVHRDEFGIKKGTYWSPKGNYLAYYRMDQSMVADYPIIDFTQIPAKNTNIKYPMAGQKSHEVYIMVHNIAANKTIILNTGEPREQYLTNIAWSPDEKYVYVAVLNRAQNHMRLNCYDAETGNFIKTLFEERDEKYTEPLNPLEFVPFHQDQFIWRSSRDGFNHIYLYKADGTLIKQITKGNFEVIDFLRFDSKGENIFYTSTAISPLQRDLFYTNIKSGENKRITANDGMHTCSVSNDGNYITDNFQSLSVPREISVLNKKGEKLETLLSVTDPLKDFNICKTQLLKLKSPDGTDLYARMYKPFDFDSSKRYPAIVYLYNGPHVQVVQNNWISSREGWFQYMAQQGYVIFNIDGRGSDYRGKLFEQATFRKLGSVEMDDQLVGVNYLKSLPYIDQRRLGVHGWSFGGFMTTSFMTRRPDIFKVGVAGGPVIDWSLYEVMYTERYMDTPLENKSGYEENNLLNFAENLKGKLLMIHGADDDVVVWQHSLLFVKKCVEKRVQLDYFTYPGHKHNVLGKDRVHLMQKITDYFKDNL